MSMDQVNLEKLQTLNGERGDKRRAAVRRGDVATLSDVQMKSKQLTAAPTLADYNNLQADLARVWSLLLGIAQNP